MTLKASKTAKNLGYLYVDWPPGSGLGSRGDSKKARPKPGFSQPGSFESWLLVGQPGQQLDPFTELCDIVAPYIGFEFLDSLQELSALA